MRQDNVTENISRALFAIHCRQRQAIVTLVMNKPRTCAEIVNLMNKPYQCIYDDLQMLVTAGIVEKGKEQYPIYMIFKKNKPHIVVIFENAKRLNRMGTASTKYEDEEEEEPES